MQPDVDFNKIIADVGTGVIDRIFERLQKTSSNTFQRLKFSFKSAYSEYLKKSSEHCALVKTILYRERSVPLNELYVHVTLRHQKTEIDPILILKDENLGKNVGICAAAGFGKSTLIKYLFLSSLKNDRYPILIILRLFNGKQSPDILQYMLDQFQTFGLNMPYDTFLDTLSLGRYAFFFDGLDELAEPTHNAISAQILNLTQRYPQNLFIVSSRPDQRFESWESFRIASVKPLTRSQSIELVQKLNYETQIKEKFISELKSNLYERFETFYSNPLLLTMMLMTYSQYAKIPEKEYLFYEQAFETLFSKHDATKSLYTRKFYSNLPIDDFRSILAAFCFSTLHERLTSISETEIYNHLARAKNISQISFDSKDFFSDLTKSLCLLVPDGLQYVFPHLTFQEYFAALFIVQLDSPDSQEKLLLRMIENNQYKLIDLAFGINREVVEKRWVIPALKSILDRINYSGLSEADAFKNFATLLMQKAEYSHHGLQSVIYSHDIDPFTRDLQIICSIYKFHHPFTQIDLRPEHTDRWATAGEVDVTFLIENYRLTNFSIGYLEDLQGKLAELEVTYRDKERSIGELLG